MFKLLMGLVLFVASFAALADASPNSPSSNTPVSNPLWHCTATSSSNAVWSQYGQTQMDAKSVAEKECRANNNKQACNIVCFPPRVYWRCLSHDTISMAANKNVPQPKQGTWFWSSPYKQVAINGALDACRHNSGFGGCFVNPNECASS